METYGVFRCPTCGQEWSAYVPALWDPWVTCPVCAQTPISSVAVLAVSPPELLTLLAPAGD